MPPLGVFFILEMGHTKMYPCTKFEIHFTLSKFTKAIPKFKDSALHPTTPHLGEFCHPLYGTWQDISVYQIKFLASPVPNL